MGSKRSAKGTEGVVGNTCGEGREGLGGIGYTEVEGGRGLRGRGGGN